MSEKKITIENNFHFTGTAQLESGADASVKVVNNFYYYNGDAAAVDHPDPMTKDTSITDPKPEQMTKDTSITDRAVEQVDEGVESGIDIVNNFCFEGGSDGFNSASVSNNFYFGEDADIPAGITGKNSITSRAVQPGQSTGDPAELPDVPNVDHQHIK